MNWLKALWSKLVNKTAVSVTTVEVEEESVAEILTSILVESGVSEEYVAEHVVARFEETYGGEATAEAVKAALNTFTEANPGLGRAMSKQQAIARLK
jgi:hypothetical protein